MSFAFDTNLTEAEEAEEGDLMQRYLIWSEEGANGDREFCFGKKIFGNCRAGRVQIRHLRYIFKNTEKFTRGWLKILIEMGRHVGGILMLTDGYRFISETRSLHYNCTPCCAPTSSDSVLEIYLIH